jgi:hypothetical protein
MRRYLPCQTPSATSTTASDLLATRSIIGAIIRPLKLTGQADFPHQRSEAGPAWGLVMLARRGDAGFFERVHKPMDVGHRHRAECHPKRPF